MARRILEPAEGNPFFLEEIVRSLVDAGALVRTARQWRFDHAVPIEIPPTVEKVILSRIDRLSPDAHTSADSSLRSRPPVRASDARGDLRRRRRRPVTTTLTELQRLDLIRESRRWPEPEYRFKHALIQEAAYRTLVRQDRERLHRTAAI